MSTFKVNNSSDVIPVGTTRVEIANQEIERLPPLPKGLTWLYCSGCAFLRKLPDLPDSLKMLICYGCTSLSELPPLPVGLTELYCFCCTSLCELPPLSHCVSLGILNCSVCTSLLYLPTIPKNCEYSGTSLPTEEKYFEEVNMGKNQEFIASRGDMLLYRIIGKDITDTVKGYLS
jgi:hypothetical protein